MPGKTLRGRPMGPKRRHAPYVVLVLILTRAFLWPSVALFASGESESPEQDLPSGADWTVGLCSFSAPGFDSSGRLALALTALELGRELVKMGVHTASTTEVEKLVESATLASRESAEKDVIAKRNARDLILFQGLSKQKQAQARDSADEKIIEALKLLEASSVEKPVANKRRIVLAKENQNDALFPPPETGKEEAFCVDKNLDAIITGWARPYYERTLLSVSLFSLADGGNLYTGEIIFSPEDRQRSISSLAESVARAALGEVPAALAVISAGADIVVDGSYRGRGVIGPLERPAGPVRVDLSAPGYANRQFDLELDSGKLSTIAITLEELRYSELELVPLTIDGLPDQESIIRKGVEYIGTGPSTVKVAEDASAYFSAETADKIAEIVVSAGAGSLAFSLNRSSDDGKELERARKAFYGAFGRFSIMLPIAFLVSGFAKGYKDRVVFGSSQETALLGARMDFAGNVLWVTAGVFVAEAVYRFTKFINIATLPFPYTKTAAKEGKQ